MVRRYRRKESRMFGTGNQDKVKEYKFYKKTFGDGSNGLPPGWSAIDYKTHMDELKKELHEILN